MAAPPSGIRMAAVFGEAQPDYGDRDADALPLRPVLFHAHAHSQGPLRVVATDLRSLAWHCSLDLDDLQDLQDDVGIGGSCSDFLDYLYSSFPPPKSSSSSLQPVVLILHSLWLPRQRGYLASPSLCIPLLPLNSKMSLPISPLRFMRLTRQSRNVHPENRNDCHSLWKV
ncbi:unnamed protein product [Urochloa humidicola]